MSTAWQETRQLAGALVRRRVGDVPVAGLGVAVVAFCGSVVTTVAGPDEEPTGDAER